MLGWCSMVTVNVKPLQCTATVEKKFKLKTQTLWNWCLKVIGIKNSFIKKFYCIICHLQFDKDVVFNIHNGKKKQPDCFKKIQFDCNLCGKRCQSKAKYNEHFNLQHSAKVIRKKCQLAEMNKGLQVYCPLPLSLWRVCGFAWMGFNLLWSFKSIFFPLIH